MSVRSWVGDHEWRFMNGDNGCRDNECEIMSGDHEWRLMNGDNGCRDNECEIMSGDHEWWIMNVGIMSGGSWMGIMNVGIMSEGSWVRNHECGDHEWGIMSGGSWMGDHEWGIIPWIYPLTSSVCSSFFIILYRFLILVDFLEQISCLRWNKFQGFISHVIIDIFNA